MSLILPTHSPNGRARASLSLISVSWYNCPFCISTASICPGPSAPFSRTVASSIGTIPASDPAITSPSPVTTYRIGRSPFRSMPAQTQRPSVIASAAGPSHGSITELQ